MTIFFLLWGLVRAKKSARGHSPSPPPPVSCATGVDPQRWLEGRGWGGGKIPFISLIYENNFLRGNWMAYVRFELHTPPPPLYAGVPFLLHQPTVPPSVRIFWMLPFNDDIILVRRLENDEFFPYFSIIVFN